MWTLMLCIALLATPAAAGSAPPPGRATGEQLYARLECAGCHEHAALPGMIVRPLSGLSRRYDEDTLTAFLAAPPPPMPVVALPEDARRELARYLLAAHP